MIRVVFFYRRKNRFKFTKTWYWGAADERCKKTEGGKGRRGR